MKTLFWLPPAMQTHCFSDAERAALAQQVDLATCPHTEHPAMLDWLVEHGQDAQILITGWGVPPLTDAHLDKLPGLKLLVHSAGSVRFLLPGSFWSRGIRLATCNEALARGVAETTLGMMIAGLKGFAPCAANTRQGGWRQWDGNASAYRPTEMYDITIGLIAASKVGRHVIRLLKSFEVDVLVTDPYLTAEEAASLGVEKVELMDLMRRSHIVSLHAPATPATQGMLRAEHFAAMRDRAIFINTARPAIVDEPALLAELQTGRIYAYLDVTLQEPPPADHPARSLPNVVLTPHIAGAISNGTFRQGKQTVQAVLDYQAGKPIYGEVTEAQAALMA